MSTTPCVLVKTIINSLGDLMTALETPPVTEKQIVEATGLLETVKRVFKQIDPDVNVSEIKISDSKKIGDFLFYNRLKLTEEITTAQTVKKESTQVGGGGWIILLQISLLAIYVVDATRRINTNGLFNKQTMNEHVQELQSHKDFNCRLFDNYNGDCSFLATMLISPVNKTVERVQALAEHITSNPCLAALTGDENENVRLGVSFYGRSVGFSPDGREVFASTTQPDLLFTKLIITAETRPKQMLQQLTDYTDAHIKGLLDVASETDGYKDGEQVVSFLMSFAKHWWLAFARRYKGKDSFGIFNVNDIGELFSHASLNTRSSMPFFYITDDFFEGTGFSMESDVLLFRSVASTPRFPYFSPSHPIIQALEGFQINPSLKLSSNVAKTQIIKYEYAGKMQEGLPDQVIDLLKINISSILEIKEILEETNKIISDFMVVQKEEKTDAQANEMFNNFQKADAPSDNEISDLFLAHGLITEEQNSMQIKPRSNAANKLKHDKSKFLTLESKSKIPHDQIRKEYPEVAYLLPSEEQHNRNKELLKTLVKARKNLTFDDVKKSYPQFLYLLNEESLADLKQKIEIEEESEERNEEESELGGGKRTLKKKSLKHRHVTLRRSKRNLKRSKRNLKRSKRNLKKSRPSRV